MDQKDIDGVALAIHALRPDWRADSLRQFLTNRETKQGLRLTDMGVRRVALALTWVALDPKTQTPARVLEAGPWWLCEPGATETPPEPPRFQTCPDHQQREPCRTCRAAIPDPDTAATYIAAIRSNIRPTSLKGTPA